MSAPPGATAFNHHASTQKCDPVNSLAHFFFAPVLSLVFVVGLLLNSFTVSFYFCRAQRRRPSSLGVYLKNLTAADFLLCLSLPVRIAHYASSSATIHLIYCSFGASALFLNMHASIVFMGYIAANRYLKIVRPSGAHILQTVRAARIICGVTWLLLLTAALVYIVLFFMAQKLTSASSHCDDQVGLLDVIVHTGAATIFLLVLVSMLFFYCSASRRVLQAQQRQQTSSGSRRLEKSCRNILVLVSIFCVCFVPYQLSRLLRLLQGTCSVLQMLFYLKEVTTMVSVLNICLDPLVYFFLCKAFRAQVRRRTLSRRRQLDFQPANQGGEESSSSSSRSN